MKKKQLISIFIIPLALFLLGSPAYSDAKGINWVSYDQAMALGKTESKKIFVTFYANWCGYCKKMDSDTFSNASVVDYINSNFINVKVNSDQERAISSKYRVSGLPSHVFISEKGETLGTLPGYMKADQFLTLLKYIQTDSYKTMKLKDFADSQKK